MVKYLRIASDLHLEQWYGSKVSKLAEQVLPVHEQDPYSLLILAGDISSFPDQLTGFIKYVENRFAKVLYVEGNHEFYRHEITAYFKNIQHQFSCLNNTLYSLDQMSCTVFEGVRYVYGTLWADGGGALNEFNVDRGLWDFRVIRNGESRFTVHDMIEIHQRQKRQLKEILNNPFDGKTVVITHHLPSYRLCHPRFGGEINGGFASNCEDILANENAPEIWIHGHTHDTIDTELWNTRIVCNPRGYRGETNMSQYNTYGVKFVELDG